MQAGLWLLTGGAAALAGIAAFADRRRARRADLDRIGWIPWPLVMLLALITAAVGAALALRVAG
jgi:hypothetical protein